MVFPVPTVLLIRANGKTYTHHVPKLPAPLLIYVKFPIIDMHDVCVGGLKELTFGQEEVSFVLDGYTDQFCWQEDPHQLVVDFLQVPKYVELTKA